MYLLQGAGKVLVKYRECIQELANSNVAKSQSVIRKLEKSYLTSRSSDYILQKKC